MRSLLITGRCPYNLYQERHLCACGVEASIFKDWAFHLPDHLEAILNHRPDIIHLQWPESLCRHQEYTDRELMDQFARCLPALKQRGAKLFWTMHNRIPHDRSREAFWKGFYQLFADNCDVCCHHSNWGMEVIRASYRFSTDQHVILRHGYFHRDVFPRVPRAEARNRLGLPQKLRVFLTVGAIRPDKHTLDLIELFRQRDPERDALILSGTVLNDYARQAEEAAGNIPNIHLKTGWQEPEAISLMADAADAFIFIHGANHLTSGSPHLSQAYLLPQVTLDSPYAREVLGSGSSYFSGLGDGMEGLHQVLNDLSADTLAEQAGQIRQTRHPWHWDIIARETRDAYERALAP